MNQNVRNTAESVCGQIKPISLIPQIKENISEKYFKSEIMTWDKQSLVGFLCGTFLFVLS